MRQIGNIGFNPLGNLGDNPFGNVSGNNRHLIFR